MARGSRVWHLTLSCARKWASGGKHGLWRGVQEHPAGCNSTMHSFMWKCRLSAGVGQLGEVLTERHLEVQLHAGLRDPVEVLPPRALVVEDMPWVDLPVGKAVVTQGATRPSQRRDMTLFNGSCHSLFRTKALFSLGQSLLLPRRPRFQLQATLVKAKIELEMLLHSVFGVMAFASSNLHDRHRRHQPTTTMTRCRRGLGLR